MMGPRATGVLLPQIREQIADVFGLTLEAPLFQRQDTGLGE